MLTVPWMTGTATTAARRAAASPLGTTARCSPTPPCTSSRARPACSSRASCGIPAPTPSTVMIWIIGSMWPPGECSLMASSPCPLFFHCRRHWAGRGGQIKSSGRLLVGRCYLCCWPWDSAVSQEKPVEGMCYTRSGSLGSYVNRYAQLQVICPWLYFPLALWRLE